MTFAFRPWAMLFALAISAAALPSLGLAFEEQDPHVALRDSLKSMTGAELEDLLFNPPPLPTYTTAESARNRPVMEMSRGYVLAEILKRDKEWATPLLEKALKQLRPKSLTAPGKDVGCDLAILTALRRLEGAPDPLSFVVNGDAPIVKGPREGLSGLKIAMKNVDKQTIALNQEGQQLTRWRAIVKDKQGREAPAISQNVFFAGQRAGGPFKPGQTWETELSLYDLVEPPPPGEATLQLLFHNEYRLAGVKDLSCLILNQSKTIDLVIEKSVVHVSAKDIELVERLVKELDGEQPLKIVAGTYGDWAHSLIDKESPAGKLLAMGAPAVPRLVEIVQDEKLSANKLAWLVCILYSLTGENDPRKDYSMLSSYSYIAGPWEAWNSKERKPAGAGNTFRTSGRGSRTSSRPVDQAKLQKLAGTWKEWLAANCEVRESAAE
jgi:hypothetical protein